MPTKPANKPVPAEFGAGLKIGRYAFTHGETPKRRLTLDTYQPAKVDSADSPLPILVMYFGGGWLNGRPGHFTPLAQAIAHRGYVTVVPEYRLSGEARFPAAAHDCKAAVRWARKNANMLDGDPDRIAVTGGSAGGHLAGFVAATNGDQRFEGQGDHLEVNSTVQAAIVMCGPMDFDVERVEKGIAASKEAGETNPYVAFFGATPTENPTIYHEASPLTHLSETMPPSLFIDGEYDQPKARYTAFWEKMDSLGIAHEFVLMKEGPHPFWNFEAWFDQTVDAIDNFLNRHLTTDRN